MGRARAYRVQPLHLYNKFATHFSTTHSDEIAAAIWFRTGVGTGRSSRTRM
jgi:hypothetical protein